MIDKVENHFVFNREGNEILCPSIDIVRSHTISIEKVKKIGDCYKTKPSLFDRKVPNFIDIDRKTTKVVALSIEKKYILYFTIETIQVFIVFDRQNTKYYIL